MDIRKIDALELLRSIPDNSVDMILTDPPYYKCLNKNDYKNHNVLWDNQWANETDFLNWLDPIIKECQRVLKLNGSFYVFTSASMCYSVQTIVNKYFRVLNHIRWGNKASVAKKQCKETMRRYIQNSEEILFCEQFDSEKEYCHEYEKEKEDIRGKIFAPLIKYLNDARKKAKLTPSMCDKICGNQMARHYFTRSQWCLPTEINYNKIKEHIELQPYGEILKTHDELNISFDELNKKYKSLRRTFNITNEVQYSNTWIFKNTPALKSRHPCEKPRDLVSHIINVSTNPGDLVVDMFAGSCSIGQACQELGRRSISGDIDDTYFPK